MHNLNKIKYFRILLQISYPFSLLILYPFVQLKKKKSTGLFFLFDRYSIGGAQKVHLDILESVKDNYKTVYFTRNSPNDKLKQEFFSFPKTCCRDIHFWCDNLLFRMFTVHYYAFYINRHKNAKLLGGNSTFFYDLLPFLNKSVVKIELLHNFSYGKKGMEFFGLSNFKYLDRRLVIDGITMKNIIRQYREYGVPEEYDNRIEVIEFGVDIPAPINKPESLPLKILYAGRGTAQKRIWLLNKIAERFVDSSEVEFCFAGSMAGELSDRLKSSYIVYNEIGEKKVMNRLYAESHAIILTSSFEGFPVTIKEGMSYGCIPIVTALPGNKIHLKHLENALLMQDPGDEAAVVDEAIENIMLLVRDRHLLRDLSVNAYEYARKHFRKDIFLKRYREILS